MSIKLDYKDWLELMCDGYIDFDDTLTVEIMDLDALVIFCRTGKYPDD